MSSTVSCGTTRKIVVQKKVSKRIRPKGTHHELSGSRFVCIDGEGFTDALGVHRYMMLGIGDDQIINKSGLEFDEILEFLYDHYESGTVYAGFFLGYDFTQWLRSLPYERAAMLLSADGIRKRQRKVTGNHAIAPHPVEYQNWQFDLLGGKRFRFRPKRCDCQVQSCPCKPKAPWMYVCDTGGFFQTSFLNVINPAKWPEPIVTPEEYATILEGKAARATAACDSTSAAYNRLENMILARVLSKYREGLEAVDVHLSASKWFGPGQAAQAWMHGRAPKREDLEATVPKWFREAAGESYFGGWFEIMMHGKIPGITHEYDINSAYPYIISSLPCLLHASYERGTGKPNPVAGQLCLVRARVWTQSYAERRKPHYIGTMLHRDAGGRISRPLITEGWFWHHELAAARKAGCITRITNDRYYEWMTITPGECPYECNPHPMRDVRSLYLRRLAVGKDTPFGIAAKLIYNSMYGKFAQSVGNPLYGNPIYASLITAGCRTMILEAIATHPKGKSNVAMVATDGVFFLDEHPRLPLSQSLGEWSHAKRSNLTLFKPGVYWDDATRGQIAQGDNPSFKARGINAAAFANELARIDSEFSEWGTTSPADSEEAGIGRSGPRWPMVFYRPAFQMTTALQAVMQHSWNRCGMVKQGEDCEPVEQSAKPYDKRTNLYYDSVYGIHRSEPKWFGEGCGVFYNPRTKSYDMIVASNKYEKRFGDEDPFSQESKERWGVTPDGLISDEFRDALRGVSAGHSIADE